MTESKFGYKGHRNFYTELNEVYFWTITINKWQLLLLPDKNKIIVLIVCSDWYKTGLLKFMAMR